MLQVRKSEDRGGADHGWLQAKHSFSFGSYYDPGHMGFRDLRVMNEDRVAPHQGFPMHGHKNMEIITYVLDGALSHEDSLGSGSTITHGMVQRMSAGSGIRHSEFNPSPTQETHLYQIWIETAQVGMAPSYEDKKINVTEEKNVWHVVASPDARDGSAKIYQDVVMYAAILDKGKKLTYENKNPRHAWIQIARGVVQVNDIILSAGDGLAISDHENLTLTAQENAEILLFDLN